MELKLNIEDNHLEAFLKIINKLQYVEIVDLNLESTTSMVSEPTVAYGNPKKLTADEVEQLIIAKCLRDAKAIERGELKTKSFDNYKDLIADLEAEIAKEDEI